jgi:hypothetical protein
LGLGAAAIGSLAVAAEPLPAPQGDVLLRVSGSIAVANDGADAAFDLSMLESLPQRRFATGTIWTEGRSAYVGVPLGTLLERLGAHGGAVRAVALNDYVATIPIAELQGDAPVVVYLRDGATIPVRERGPLWILYPFDDEPVWRTEVAYSRSVWQLVRLDVVD